MDEIEHTIIELIERSSVDTFLTVDRDTGLRLELHYTAEHIEVPNWPIKRQGKASWPNLCFQHKARRCASSHFRPQVPLGGMTPCWHQLNWMNVGQKGWWRQHRSCKFWLRLVASAVNNVSRHDL